MKLNLPWIVSRRRIIFAITVDMFLNIYLYSEGFYSNFYTYPNQIVTISLAIFWVMTSYIFGRYMVCKNIIFLEIIKTLIKSLSLFLLCNIVYLFINSFSQLLIFLLNNEYGDFEFERNQTLFFLRITLIISIFSWFIQYIISIITNKIYQSNKYWLFSGSKDGLNNLIKEVKINSKIFKFKILDSDFNANNFDFDDVEGIIIENDDNSNLEQIFLFKSKGIIVLNALKWCELSLHRLPPYLIVNKYQIIENFNLLDNSYKIRIKRLGDFFISFLLLLTTMPLSLLIALFIYLEDRGPIFYSQIRTGYKGERIRIYKFRSMVKNAEKNGAQWSTIEDDRITRVGKIIRATRLDELPQLFAVIQGKMSLIGPRPERPELEEKLLQAIPYYNYRNVLKPGISGWAQVNYPYGSSIDDTKNKLSYDIYYINHISFLLDMLILFKTIKTVFNAKLNNKVY